MTKNPKRKKHFIKRSATIMISGHILRMPQTGPELGEGGRPIPCTRLALYRQSDAMNVADQT